MLTFHPDTKYITEYCVSFNVLLSMYIQSFKDIIIFQDWACRLCDFITLNVNEIINHMLLVHDIDIYQVNIGVKRKKAKKQINLEDIIISKLTFIILIKIYFVFVYNYINIDFFQIHIIQPTIFL